MFILRRRWQLAICVGLVIGVSAFFLLRKSTNSRRAADPPNETAVAVPPKILLEEVENVPPTAASTQLPTPVVPKNTDPQLIVDRSHSFEESLRLRERLRVRALPQWEDDRGTHYPFLISQPSESELQEMRALANSTFEDFGPAEQQQINEARNAILKQWTDFQNSFRYVDILVPKKDNANLQVVQSDIAGEESLKKISKSNPNMVIPTGGKMEMLTITNSGVGWRYSHLLHTSAE